MQVAKKKTPWLLIVFCFVIFWPLGVILLIKRLAVDRSATITCGKPLTGLAYILSAIGIIYLFVTISQGSGLTVHAALLIAGGIWLSVLAYKTKETGERYRKYIDLIVNNSQTSLDYIASQVGVTFLTAVGDLKRMIDLGYFPGAFVNVPAKEIRLAGSDAQLGFQFARADPVPIQEPPEAPPRVVSCRSCGANNKVPAWQVIECEYCGTPVQ